MSTMNKLQIAEAIIKENQEASKSSMRTFDKNFKLNMYLGTPDYYARNYEYFYRKEFAKEMNSLAEITNQYKK